MTSKNNNPLTFSVILGLGSNLGNRKEYITKATKALEFISLKAIKKSSIYETEPLGPPPQNKYLNQCIEIRTHYNPYDLLAFCKYTERKIGRKIRARWKPREIDIDILTYGNLIIKNSLLTIPHPEIMNRTFVLIPLSELYPNLKLPSHSITIKEKLKQKNKNYTYTSMIKLPDHIHYLAIEGIIGSGKTSLVKCLEKHLECNTLLEQVDLNPFIENFYKNREIYAFQTQINFLFLRYQQLVDNFSQSNLLTPLTISDFIFDKDKIFANINLNEKEILLYNKISKLIEVDIPNPDYIIYLQADTDTLLRRIYHRNRKYEKNIDENYIQKLNDAYNDYFLHYTKSPLFIINTNEINFVENSEDLKLLMKLISEAPNGINYFSPSHN